MLRTVKNNPPGAIFLTLNFIILYIFLNENFINFKLYIGTVTGNILKTIISLKRALNYIFINQMA